MPQPASIRRQMLIATAVAAISLPSFAQSPSAPQQTQSPAQPASSTSSTAASGMAKPSALAAADKKFINNAAQGGMAEVQLGQLASQRASDPQVKQFAEQLVNDHSKANEKLKQIASDKGVALPADIPASAKREAAKLSKLNGPAFDREYMTHMVSDHKKDVSEFRAATKKARDPDVNQFAQQTLPTIEQHLQIAQGMVSKAK